MTVLQTKILLEKRLGISLDHHPRVRIDLSSQRIFGLDCIGLNLGNANLTDTIFDECKIDSLTLKGADLTRTVLINTQIKKWVVENCRFVETDLGCGRVYENWFTNCIFRGLKGVDDLEWLKNYFDHCRFENFEMARSKMNCCFFYRCRGIELNWPRLEMDFVRMEKCSFAETCAFPKSGFRQSFFFHNNFDTTDFHESDFHFSQVIKNNFCQTIMSNVSFGYAKLEDNSFTEANLYRAKVRNMEGDWNQFMDAYNIPQAILDNQQYQLKAEAFYGEKK